MDEFLQQYGAGFARWLGHVVGGHYVPSIVCCVLVAKPDQFIGQVGAHLARLPKQQRVDLGLITQFAPQGDACYQHRFAFVPNKMFLRVY